MSPAPSPQPPNPSPALPSFALVEDEQQPQRGEDGDFDMLSGWARSLSVSPRLYPTYANGASHATSSSMGLTASSFGLDSTFGAGSFRGLAGESPVLGPLRKASHLNVGTGLSPELGPTRLGASSAPLGGANSMLMASGHTYNYGFGSQYHASPPSEALAFHHHSPHGPSPQTTLVPSATQSFAHMDKHASISPALSPGTAAVPPLAPSASPDMLLHTPFASTSAQPTPAEAVSTQLAPPQQMPQSMTTPAAEEDEDPRIRAYAKLEFPTFDIYIQKLSVIIGRRPAAAVLAAAANMQQAARSPSIQGVAIADTNGNLGAASAFAPAETAAAAPPPQSGTSALVTDARGDHVKLEDFVMGMTFDDSKPSMSASAPTPASPGNQEVKTEQVDSNASSLVAPALQVTPSSPQGPHPEDSESAGKIEDPFAAFLQSSPSLPPTTNVTTASSAASESNPPALALGEQATSAQAESIGAPVVEPVSTLAPAEDVPDAATSATEPVSAPPVVDTSAPAPTPVGPPPGFLTDIDLGPIRAVSRQHARLYFDYDLGAWAIEVMGRNGVVVDGKWKAKGETEMMSARTKIQIAERVFFFVLPNIDPSAIRAGGMGAGAESPLTEIDDDLSGDSDDDDEDEERENDNGDSSSLSELSESDVELSPLQNAQDDSCLDGVPPLDAGPAGKRLESLKAVKSKGKGKGKASRSTGGGGKGKNAMRRGGKGKGKMLPPKRLRRDSFRSYDDEEAGGEDDPNAYAYGYGYGYDYDLDEEDDADDDSELALSPPKRNVELKRAVESKRPNFADSMKAPRPYAASKAHGKMPSQRQLVPKIVLKRNGSSSASTTVAPSAVSSKQPRKGRATNVMLDAALLPPLPDAVASGSGTLNGDALPAAFSLGNLPPLPPDAMSPSPLTSKADLTSISSNGRLRKKSTVGAEAAANAGNLVAVAEGAKSTNRVPYTPAPWPADQPLPDEAPLTDLLIKPPYTYASLIAQCTTTSVGRKQTLQGICDWVEDRWPYFRYNQPGWQNSIRHNLTPSRGFVKVPRRAGEGGKGSFWQLDPNYAATFDGHHLRKKGAKDPKPAPAIKTLASQTVAAKAPRVVTKHPAPSVSTLARPMTILIAPIPATYVRPAPPPNAPPPDELTAALLKDPPIIFHGGKLLLNPATFSTMSSTQLQELQVIPAHKSLQILQHFVVQHFKGKMKRMQVAAGVSSTPAPNTPLIPAITVEGPTTDRAKSVAQAASPALSSTRSPSVPAMPASDQNGGVTAAAKPSLLADKGRSPPLLAASPIIAASPVSPAQELPVKAKRRLSTSVDVSSTELATKRVRASPGKG